MEGAYKTKLSESQLEQAIRAIFDEDIASCSELTHGWANSAYAVELAGGKKVVLKARPSTAVRLMRCEVDTMKAEVLAMRRLAEADPTFPAPAIYAYDDSLELLPVEYFVMDYIEGTLYNQVKSGMPEQERNVIEFQLGQLNRRINEVRGDQGFGYYANPVHTSWRRAFADMIQGVLEDGKESGVELSIPYEELEKEIERRLPALDEVIEPRLVHWDLWDGNVFVKDGKISGIVDFERAMWGEPLIEQYFGKFNASPGFREGYGYHPSTPTEIARRELYDLFLDLILFIECPFRKYENEGHVQWTRDNLEEGLKKFMATE
ncbi:aminoglycoside phosphotransferase family protein [Cohnella endophytica]|uniref:Aminoglycoside phosphotransferase family protein n=1 Tax=Cohnella endophytica TaxID=2419778 RepID=A0A494XQZ8_9BACL|nr:aminoglycoside phosphotransferase family protein [Cohnella endophytica]RKP53060.1 aminoglycoside phosphotransferase family protein [Cohnella endophytica]